MDGWEKLKASPEQSCGNEVGYCCPQGTHPLWASNEQVWHPVRRQTCSPDTYRWLHVGSGKGGDVREPFEVAFNYRSEGGWYHGCSSPRH